MNDVSASFVEPALEGLLRASIADNSVELHMPLLRSVPHLARTGDADTTVHSFWARRAVRVLGVHDALDGGAEANATSGRMNVLSELRGKEHWWWDTDRENDGGALNDDEMRAFFDRALATTPARTRPALPELPDDFTLLAHAAGAFEGRAGWRILQGHEPGRMSSVRMRRLRSTRRDGSAGDRYGGDRGNGGGGDGKAGVLELTTRNVRRLLAPRSTVLDESTRLLIDTRPVLLLPAAEAVATARTTEDGDAESIELCRLSLGRGVQWRVCTRESWAVAERGPSTAGPLRQAFHQPFAIVYGGSSSADGGFTASGGGNELEDLAVYLANLFTLTSDATPPMVPDATSDGLGGGGGGGDGSEGAFATNLLLIGGPRDNAASARIAAYWASVGHAARWDSGGVLSIGGCEMPSARVGSLILGPTPSGGLALILDGDSEGLRDAIAAGEPTIPPMARTPFSNTLPDYIVTGPEFGAKGFGGLHAAGFLDYAWRAPASASWLGLGCVSAADQTPDS